MAERTSLNKLEIVYGPPISPELEEQKGAEVRAWTDYRRGAGREGLSSGVPAYGMASSEVDDAALKFNKWVDARIETVAEGYRKVKARVMATVRRQRPV